MYIAFISNADCPNRLSFDGHPSTSKFLLLQIKKKTNKLKSTKKQCIWFNPYYSRNVCAKVGPYFLNLINKHFSLHCMFSKVFNRSNMNAVVYQT